MPDLVLHVTVNVSVTVTLDDDPNDPDAIADKLLASVAT